MPAVHIMCKCEFSRVIFLKLLLTHIFKFTRAPCDTGCWSTDHTLRNKAVDSLSLDTLGEFGEGPAVRLSHQLAL